MKADFSRIAFNLKKGYTRILQQQGRVSLDADWNEQVSIQADLDRHRLQDGMGHCAVPLDDPGFEVELATSNGDIDLKLNPGTIYVAGHRIRLDAPTSYLKQPFRPNPPKINPPNVGDRVDLLYLRVREQHITHLEDAAIREVALGGPDTTTRVRTIWQLDIKEGVNLKRCEEDAAAEMQSGVGAGLLTTIITPPSEDEDPCVTPVNSGYTGLENRLYRVEVHSGGTIKNADGTIENDASVKWSRYNGAVAFKVLEINVSNRILTLGRLGWDQIVTLSPNNWIELISEDDELAGNPGVMLQISNEAGAANSSQRQITLKSVDNITSLLAEYRLLIADEDNKKLVKARLWDGAALLLKDHVGSDSLSAQFPLEDGISVKIRVNQADDIFRTGDYWTFAARTITGEIDLPLADSPPQGQEWHSCKLALIHWKENGSNPPTPTIEDCRPFFPALTELLQLHYVGGDGQTVIPGEVLAGALMLRVSRGEYPAPNVPIVFRVQGQGVNGRVFSGTNPTRRKNLIVYTDEKGLAVCHWRPDDNIAHPHQQVLAYIDAPNDSRRHQQVVFNAHLNFITDDPAFHVIGAYWNREELAVHDSIINIEHLVGGLGIECDAPPDPSSIISPPSGRSASVFMTLELPVIDGSFQSYILAGDVSVDGNLILWEAGNSRVFLEKHAPNLVKQRGPFLTRFFLKGSKIWQLENPEIHLDGDVTSTPDGMTPHNLNLPSGDGERGGDFEMWFHLEMAPARDTGKINVVGVLHPTTFLGFGIMRDGDNTITNQQANAIISRLDALDMAYNHQAVIEAAGITDYTVSNTGFNANQARARLRQSGFDAGSAEYLVLAQPEYEHLAHEIINSWQQVFEQPHQITFSVEVQEPNTLEEVIPTLFAAGHPVSFLIYNEWVLDQLVGRQEASGELLIRREFVRPV